MAVTAFPQHYRRYKPDIGRPAAHRRRYLLARRNLLFADEDGSGLYLQVGLIGRENYERGSQIRPHKLVYGRKWRIDPDTPTSEVIQTAFSGSETGSPTRSARIVDAAGGASRQGQ